MSVGYPQATCETCRYFFSGMPTRESECRKTPHFYPRAKSDWCGEHPDFDTGKASVATLMRPADFAEDAPPDIQPDPSPDLPPDPQPAAIVKPATRTPKASK